jgi:hypothetical protein
MMFTLEKAKFVLKVLSSRCFIQDYVCNIISIEITLNQKKIRSIERNFYRIGSWSRERESKRRKRKKREEFVEETGRKKSLSQQCHDFHKLELDDANEAR